MINVSAPTASAILQHTPEPWFVFGNGHCVGGPCMTNPDADTGGIAMCGMRVRSAMEAAANTSRIVKCVNALAGITDVERFVAYAKADGPYSIIGMTPAELIALAMVYAGEPSSKVADALPSDAWDNLRAMGLIATTRDNTDEHKVNVTDAGRDALWHAAVASGADAMSVEAFRSDTWPTVEKSPPPLNVQLRVWRHEMLGDTVADGELHATTDGDGCWMIGPDLILRKIHPLDRWQRVTPPAGVWNESHRRAGELMQDCPKLDTNEVPAGYAAVLKSSLDQSKGNLCRQCDWRPECQLGTHPYRHNLRCSDYAVVTPDGETIQRHDRCSVVFKRHPLNLFGEVTA